MSPGPRLSTELSAVLLAMSCISQVLPSASWGSFRDVPWIGLVAVWQTLLLKSELLLPSVPLAGGGGNVDIITMFTLSR